MTQKREVEVYEEAKCPVCGRNWARWCRKCNSVYCVDHHASFARAGMGHKCQGTPGFGGGKKK